MEFDSKISDWIWNSKYRFFDSDGNALDSSIDDTWMRIAKTLASVEKDTEYWTQQFYGALREFKFLPAGRIIAGA